MTRLTDQIGFSQRVRLEWLEETARLVLAGNEQATINASLQALLKEKVSIGGTAERGNREKIITILQKVWLTGPAKLEPLRLDGLELLKRLSRQERVAVHWGMVTAVYPFWASVAIQVGRLLRLQRSAAASHVQRRMREQYGERETVSRAARRVLRSYVDWKLLDEGGSKGIYVQRLLISIDDLPLVSWLIEASLHTRTNGSAAVRDLLEGPELFPFQLKTVTADYLLNGSPRLDVFRHGLGEDIVMLRKQKMR